MCTLRIWFQNKIVAEALTVAQQRWEEAPNEYAKEKASVEKLATQKALDELENERMKFLEEKDLLQEETLRISKQVEELESDRDEMNERLEQCKKFFV